MDSLFCHAAFWHSDAPAGKPAASAEPPGIIPGPFCIEIGNKTGKGGGAFGTAGRRAAKDRPFCMGAGHRLPAFGHRRLLYIPPAVSALAQSGGGAAQRLRQGSAPRRQTGGNFPVFVLNDRTRGDGRHRQPRRRRDRDGRRRPGGARLDVDFGAVWHGHEVRGMPARRQIPREKQPRGMVRRADVYASPRLLRASAAWAGIGAFLCGGAPCSPRLASAA